MTAGDERTRAVRWGEAAAWLVATGLLVATADATAGTAAAAAAAACVYAAGVRRLTRREALREVLERQAWTIGSCLAILYIGNEGLSWGLPGSVLAAAPAVCAALETARQ